MYTFDSQIQYGTETQKTFSVEDVKNEPMLFNCDIETAARLGGTLTKEFLSILPDDWKNSNDFIVDSRVHMLMPGFFPCIPGFHHDDVPREREDGQPNYINPSYRAEHVLMLVGDCCPTEFAIGESKFPEVPTGGKYYKVWHPMVVDKIKSGELISVSAPSNRLVFFNDRTWHQGVRAKKGGWRWFIRASRNTKRKPTNELRRQVQVYLETPMEGW